MGLSDNTRLESYVSLYKTFANMNMTGASIENHFLYHAGLEAERMQLRSPEMRSNRGGAKRSAAKQRADKGKMLASHNGPKKQQAALCELALKRAKAMDPKRFATGGDSSLTRLYAQESAAGESFKAKAARRSVVAQTASCAVGQGCGQRRKAVAPPEAYRGLLNQLVEAGAKAPKRQGTGYGNDALKKKAKTVADAKRAAQPPPGTTVPKPTKSGKRRTERQLRQLAVGAERAVPKPKARRAKKAATATASANVGVQDELDQAAR